MAIETEELKQIYSKSFCYEKYTLILDTVLTLKKPWLG